jgi:hypothetical protein
MHKACAVDTILKTLAEFFSHAHPFVQAIILGVLLLAYAILLYFNFRNRFKLRLFLKSSG